MATNNNKKSIQTSQSSSSVAVLQQQQVKSTNAQVNGTDHHHTKQDEDSFSKIKRSQRSQITSSLINLVPLKMENRKTTKIVS